MILRWTQVIRDHGDENADVIQKARETIALCEAALDAGMKKKVEKERQVREEKLDLKKKAVEKEKEVEKERMEKTG